MPHELLLTPDLIDDFLAHLIDEDLAATTIENYRQELADFLRHEGAVSRKRVHRWIERDSLAPSTRNRRLAIMRRFGKYLKKHGYVAKNPARGLKRAKIPRRRRIAVTANELAIVLEATRTAREPWIGARDRALIALAFYTGLRLAELLALRVSSVDLRSSLVREARRKGGHATDEHLSRPARRALAEYIELRPANRETALFLAQHGGAPTRRAIQKRLKYLGHQAGLADRLHPHALRHAHATELDRSGASVPVIQDSLNHAKLETTRRYIHPAGSRVEAARNKLPDLLALERRNGRNGCKNPED